MRACRCIDGFATCTVLLLEQVVFSSLMQICHDTIYCISVYQELFNFVPDTTLVSYKVPMAVLCVMVFFFSFYNMWLDTEATSVYSAICAV